MFICALERSERPGTKRCTGQCASCATWWLANLEADDICLDCKGSGRQSDYDLGLRTLAHSDLAVLKRHTCLGCLGSGRKPAGPTGASG